MRIIAMPGVRPLKLRLRRGGYMPPVVQMTTPHEMNWKTAVNGKGVGGFVKGQVRENDIPVSRRVMCYHRRTGSLIAKTWSDTDGNFQFNDLEPGVHLFLTSVNDKGLVVPFNAVTEDLIVSQPIQGVSDE